MTLPMLRGAVGLLGALCLFGCASTAAPDLELSLPDPDPGAAAVREIAAWGDSMTADADTVAGYPKYLAELLERPVYNGGVVGEQSFAIYYRFLAATDCRSDLSIFWMGRNNYQALGDGTVMADIAAAVANLRGQKHFLVVSICNGDIADEYVGAAHYRWLTALNDSLRTRYASNFVDIRDSLIA
ncbi:MAG: hypothetical protein ABJA11_04335, partial [Pseudolysinimonas sp.]